jgi:hypothetical protein
MEIFIATDTASVQLFFNIFTTGTETFVNGVNGEGFQL